MVATPTICLSNHLYAWCDMKKPTLIYSVLGLVLLLPFVAGAIFFLLPLPPHSGSDKVAGLSSDARVLRDKHGVPHIFANTFNDAYAALGYVHASDRLFQMEMMRRAGAGRLSEILGRDLINYDRKMRALGFATRIEAYYKSLSQDARDALDAYARGVNAVLEKKNYPAEFALLKMTPAPWQPWDGLIWAKMMAWQLSGNWEDEVLREQLLHTQELSKEQIGAIYPPMDHNVPSVIKPLQWIKQNKTQANQDVLKEPSIAAQLSAWKAYQPSGATPFDHLPRTASNAYVISGAHTSNRKPILANDPHLQLQSPILWYLARIVTSQGSIKGATAPGLPFFPLGQNSHVAWGFTTSNIDVADITFIPEAAKNFTVRHEIIHVKDDNDVSLMVEENDQGVVLTHHVDSISAITPRGKKALLQFTGFSKTDKTAQALFDINNATSAAGIESALKNYSVPPQNLLYADDENHIGYAAVGVVPKRSNDGFYAGENKVWQGMMTQNPRLKDPEAGIILSANQAIMDDASCRAFSCAFARDWAEPYRAMRLESWFDNELSQRIPFDVQRASMPMLDITSVAAQRFLPTMLGSVSAKTDESKEILEALSRWDGRMERGAAEPLIYHAWLDALMRMQLRDAYTADVTWPRMWALEHMAIANITMNMAFDKALKDLHERHGPAWKQWRWGDEHVAPLTHPVWSRVPLIKDWTSLAIASDGDGHTLRRAAPGDYNKPFEVEHGAGYRGVYDLGDPAQSLFVIAGGQSGQIFSPDYGSLRDAWNDGKFIHLRGNEHELKSAGVRVLTLTP